MRHLATPISILS